LSIKRFCKKVIARLSKESFAVGTGESDDQRIISRSQHGLSRKCISENALKVLYRLKKSGYSAYLVGGGVRDLLMQMPSKDFDVATDATPEQLRDLFVNSRIIGRRFRIVHVMFRGEIIEVSTFRAEIQQLDGPSSNDFETENVFGNLQEDAWRRDFTVNALYYNINDFSIVDYTGGWADMKQRKLRFIGDASERAEQDPVRLLRALRFAAKLNLEIDNELQFVLNNEDGLVLNISPPRLLYEFEKIFCTGYALPTFYKLIEFGYLQYFLSSECIALVTQEGSAGHELVITTLANCDERYKDNKHLNLGFVLATFLWPVLQQCLSNADFEKRRLHQVLHSSMTDIMKKQQAVLNISKRHVAMMKSVWLLQYNLERRRPKRTLSLLRHRYYRAAFDLLELRSKQQPKLKNLVKWWSKLYGSSAEQREQIAGDLIHKSRSNNKKNDEKE
jgi:poly(A) polymerase